MKIEKCIRENKYWSHIYIFLSANNNFIRQLDTGTRSTRTLASKNPQHHRFKSINITILSSQPTILVSAKEGIILIYNKKMIDVVGAQIFNVSLKILLPKNLGFVLLEKRVKIGICYYNRKTYIGFCRLAGLIINLERKKNLNQFLAQST